MQLPHIHLNGTSAASLSAAYQEAYTALDQAFDALVETAPNARDYYPIGPSAFEEAREEHRARLAAVRKVYEEIESLIIAVEG